DANAPNYLATLEELVHIELEFRWKAEDAKQRISLEDYLQRFEQLNRPEIVKRLVQQEVRLRTAIGDTPVGAEYQKRFQDVTLDFPTVQQGQQDTGQVAVGKADTRREMATIMPDRAPVAGPGYSATLPGVGMTQSDIVLDLETVPGYDLLGELGRGGMGVVYKARDQKLKRIVALKMILSGAHASDEDMQRFQTEAEAVARLQHPNIVQIYEVGEHEGKPYIALEFADSGSLDKVLTGKPQNAEESAQLIETLARAIEVAHQQAIIHRDLKPANILLTEEGEPKITDFGLAKRMDEDSNQTKSGAVMGTPSYMAPEQAASKAETLGPAADTYALGAVLYHMLAGRPPFQAETQLDTLMQVIEDEPLPLRRLVSSVPVDLETICLKCLQKDIHRRYERAEELAEDLRRFLAGEPIQARPVSMVERSWKWARRRPAVAGMISVSAAALVGLILFGLSYNTQLKKQRDASRLQTKTAIELKQISELRETETYRLKNEAEQARLETLQRMAYSNVDTGVQLQKAGNLPESLIWFADALRLDQGIPDRERIHRQRIAQMVSVSFRPKHVWFPPTPTANLWGTPGLTDVRFSPDFQKVVASTADGVIYLWDIDSGKMTGEPLEHEGAVSDIAFDHTGNLLAAAVLLVGGEEPTGKTIIWDLSTGKQLKEKYRQDRGTA
ncbi:MAG: serine/threonine-protein kinase, partial [Pseudomonadales bacterium]|nr:serine/threonine-protein kinase [Pseudomonadales bacterium]